MSCNRDDGCLKIAESTYPSLQSEINTSVNSINTELSDVVSSLQSLTIPDDYLGEKVKDRITSITASLGDDQSSVDAINSELDSFISEKITEHTEHYNEWLQEQERLAQEAQVQANQSTSQQTSSTVKASTVNTTNTTTNNSNQKKVTTVIKNQNLVV